MQKYVVQSLNQEVTNWINSNLKSYLEKKDVIENQSEIEHIIDYLNSDKAPKRLMKMSYKEANESAKRWLKTLVKKGIDQEDVEDVDYDIVIDFNDGFKLIKLKSELAYSREGNLMGHCVKSYFNRKDSSIYSLRDSRNMPHCTLEINKSNNGEFNQVKGKGNGSIHHKYIKYILDTMKHFKINIRDTEMQNLGYLSMNFIKSYNKGGKWLLNNTKYETVIINDNTYIYSNSLKLRG